MSSAPAAPRLAAITDEFSYDLDIALDAMLEVGMTGAELRIVGGRNVIELDDDEISAVRAAVERRGMTVISIASPVLKCVLPDGPPLDPRVQQDVFGSRYEFTDQPQLARRAFDIAERTGAAIVRVFSYWRTTAPGRCHDRIVDALSQLADRAHARGLIVGLENEHGCNVGTGAETATILEALGHPALGVIWDPANAYVLGETPYPDGYAALSPSRIVHVHAKDCHVRDHVPTWGPLGTMAIDWAGQIDALERDGYAGWISLETHWRGDDRLDASRICGRTLYAMTTGAPLRHER
jgi:sugar phosphate isomerase/epimerase